MCYPTIERAATLKLPVLVHTGWGEHAEIRFVEKLAKDFKDLHVVIAHMIEHKDIFSMIPKHNNVSLETSYSSHPRRIAQAVNSLGADRVVFGSDFPCSDPGFELLRVLKAPITDSQKEKILFKNAEKLLATAI